MKTLLVRPLTDLTIKECEEYHKTCGRVCWERSCPLLVGNACILDLTGTSNDVDTINFYKRQGLEFRNNMTVGEIVDEIIERKVCI